jgi:hypothetical protein
MSSYRVGAPLRTCNVPDPDGAVGALVGVEEVRPPTVPSTCIVGVK